MQALIITAYKNTEQLMELLNSVCDKFYVFLHIDKKSDINVNKIKEANYPNLKIFSTYSITWGGYNHLASIIDLLREACIEQCIDYIHIISGQDILVRSYEEFDKMFSSSSKIYMTCSHILDCDKTVRNRLERFVLSADLDSRRIWVRVINGITYVIQKLAFGKRKKIGDLEKIYKGMVWVSFPVNVGKYVLDYVDSSNKLMKDLYHTVIPEEFFFQTILMNSKYKENIVKENLRYTDWTGRNGSNPSFLDESDFDKIKNSNAFFARKIDPIISKKLINMIKRDVLF